MWRAWGCILFLLPSLPSYPAYIYHDVAALFALPSRSRISCCSAQTAVTAMPWLPLPAVRYTLPNDICLSAVRCHYMAGLFLYCAGGTDIYVRVGHAGARLAASDACSPVCCLFIHHRHSSLPVGFCHPVVAFAVHPSLPRCTTLRYLSGVNRPAHCSLLLFSLFLPGSILVASWCGSRMVRPCWWRRVGLRLVGTPLPLAV